MAITAKELARKLNISATAVSMALNNKPGVSTETRKQIIKAAEKYGYDFTKLSFKKNQAGEIYCIIYKSHNAILKYTPIFSELTDGIGQVCEKEGYHLKLVQINENIDNVQKWIEDIRIANCAGVILLGTEISLNAAKAFTSLSVPVVLLDSYFDALGCSSVLINNEQGAYLATNYLIDRYNKQPGHLCSSYKIENFDKVRAKKNEIEILNRELKSKRKKGVIGIGAMSDTYNPFEKQYEITRQSLELISYYNFGVSIETKSNLIVRDIDIFKEINKKADVILKFTITSADDNLSQKVEPGVCVSSERLKAMKQLSKEGLFVGTLLTPIIPFITDSEENIRNVIRLSYENGAKFVFSMGGVTLRENQREYFYEQLDKTFPKIKEKYIKTYGNNYFCYPLNKNLDKIFKEECNRYGILYNMKDIIKAYKKEIPEDEQMTLFI